MLIPILLRLGYFIAGFLIALLLCSFNPFVIKDSQVSFINKKQVKTHINIDNTVSFDTISFINKDKKTTVKSDISMKNDILTDTVTILQKPSISLWLNSIDGLSVQYDRYDIGYNPVNNRFSVGYKIMEF